MEYATGVAHPAGMSTQCCIVAEVAQAHDGSLGTAHAFIDACARAGRQGQAAIRSHRECWGRERHCTGVPGGARGDGVSTSGRDEQGLRAYLRHQEPKAKGQEELQLLGSLGYSRLYMVL